MVRDPSGVPPCSKARKARCRSSIAQLVCSKRCQTLARLQCNCALSLADGRANWNSIFH